MKQYAVFVAAAALVSCGSPTTESPAPEQTPDNNAAANNVVANNVAENNTAENNVAENNTEGASVLYYEDVKPIIDGKCAGCHTQGGIGPFPLTTYDEVAEVAGLVGASVQNGDMPPFIYDQKTCREYTHNPELSDEQIELITTWVDEGAEAGSPENEGEPLPNVEYEAPELDTTLQMPVPYTPRQSPDDYRCFLVDWPHDTTKFITGFGVEPGDAETVHHVIGFLAEPDQVAEAEMLDANEEGEGWTCFGAPGLSDQTSIGWLGSWAPGGVPHQYPGNSGMRIEPGSKVIMQVHYNTLTTEPRPDQTTIRVQTADTVEQEGFWMPWTNPLWFNGSMDIPAGEADVMHQFSFDATRFASNGRPMKIWGGGLHQHLLGTSSRAFILREDGSEECLLSSPKYDFNWQTGVQFAEAAVFNPGDRLGLECHWDNSMDNQPVVDGSRVTPADRNWGDGTLDEMCLGIFYVTIGD